MFDTGYYAALNDPKLTLLPNDNVVDADGDYAITASGKKIKADIIVLCTVSSLAFHNKLYLLLMQRLASQGFKVRDC